MYLSDPPFALGETLQGKDADGNLINSHWLGQKFLHPAKPATSQAAGNPLKRRSGSNIIAMPIRNVSGVTLYGKRLCVLDAITAGIGGGTGGYLTTKGYAVATGDVHCGIIDEFIEVGGVADDDIFWCILEGPVTCKMQTLAAAASVTAPGAWLIAGSGAGTAANSTAGGVGMTTAPLVTQLVGKALSGRTTADTGADVLILAHIRYF